MEGFEPASAWGNYFGSRLSPARKSPKVVSVPVRFVSNDRWRSDAAAKIQKVFRSFVVRRSVKKIAAVKREVDGVERTISSPDTAKILRRDEKERLRLNETLMSLLLRLDSVRGVYSGVREFRKSVIRKAIALQERIDAIASSPSAANAESKVSELEDREESESKEPEIESVQVQVGAKEEEADVSEGEPMPDPTEADSETEFESSPEANEEEEEEEKEAMETGNVSRLHEDEIEVPKPDSDSESENESSSSEVATQGKGGNSRRLMERMLEDNEKLMGMVSELHERSAAQTQLLSSLSQRVEQLERAFVCDKLSRKKKKQRRGCDYKANSGNRFSQL